MVKMKAMVIVAAALTAMVAAQPLAAQAAKPKADAAKPAADAMQMPNFQGTKWTVTPGQNSQNARASTVWFNKNGTDSVAFLGGGAKSGGTWSIDAKQGYVYWFANGAEGPGTIRAFRWSWKVQIEGGGYSCMVANTNLNFACLSGTYNFKMTQMK